MNDWNFWSVTQQVIIVLSILSQILVAFKVVVEAQGAEQFVRSSAIAAGVLIFLGSKMFGLTFADLMFLAVTDAGLIKIILAGTIVPMIIGVLVAYMTISAMESGSDFAIRILLLIGVFTLLQIAYLNFYALTEVDIAPEKALLPNLCYSLSVMLWVIFNFEDKKGIPVSRY